MADHPDHSRSHTSPAADETPDASPQALLAAWWADPAVSEKQIAAHFGVAPKTIASWARSLQLPPRDGHSAGLEERIRQAWADAHLTLDSICDQLGMTRVDLSKAVQRLRLPAGPDTDRGTELRAELRRLWAQPLTRQQIADRLGVSIVTVDTWRRELDLPPRASTRRPADTPARQAEFKELWARQDLTRKDIAKQLGISIATMHIWRHELRLPQRQR